MNQKVIERACDIHFNLRVLSSIIIIVLEEKSIDVWIIIFIIQEHHVPLWSKYKLWWKCRVVNVTLFTFSGKNWKVKSTFLDYRCGTEFCVSKENATQPGNLSIDWQLGINSLLKNYWIFQTVPLLFQFILHTRLTKAWRWTCRWKSRRSCRRFSRTPSWRTSPSKTIWTPSVKKYPGFRGRTATCSWRRLRQLEAGRCSCRSKSQGSLCCPFSVALNSDFPQRSSSSILWLLSHACLCPGKICFGVIFDCKA